MTAINLSTQRRLKQLPQIPSVWEGDRRYVGGLEDLDTATDDERQELILWVDGVEGVVRSMEVVNQTMGKEAIVRALIEAMESPQAPSQPARPQKIIVRDRQLQFYLRGVLQDLEIAIEYVPELPIVDELFNRFVEMAGARKSKLPRKYLDGINAAARDIWDLAPWSILADGEVISIELNAWDIEKFYISVMGMMGLEYGILLYRSAESLHRFRAMALNEPQSHNMESAFLLQDCIFLTFDAKNPDMEADLDRLPSIAIEPGFGNIHPMEGMRPFLYQEEAIATQVALIALKQFVEAFKPELSTEKLPSLTQQILIVTPDTQTQLNVVVETLPELSEELLQMQLAGDDDDDFDPMELPIEEDLIPDDSFVSVGIMPWERVETLRLAVAHHQPSEVKSMGEGLPVILIQTTRPKANEIIEYIEETGGLAGICFNQGADLTVGASFDVGILQLADGEMQLFGEFDCDDPEHFQAKKEWEIYSKITLGYCALILAGGVTGKSRGNPGLRETIAFLETKVLSQTEIGLGLLELIPDFD